MNWSDVTLEKFQKLQQIIKLEDNTDRMLSIMELFYGEDVTDLPVAEFNKMSKELAFLQNEVPTNHIVNKVTINNRKYKIDAVLGHLSTAQYVDFVNYMNQPDNTDKVLSVFFIPENHKYNDGYDMQQVIADMNQLPIDIALSESFFFRRQLEKFIKIFQSSSTHQILKSKMTKDQKKQLINLLHQSLDLV